MTKKGMVAYAGSITSLPFALLLLVLFFVPWLRVTCQGPATIELGKPSGWQMAVGWKIEQPDLQSQGMGAPQQPQQSPADQDDSEKELKSRPALMLGLILPVLVLLLGAIALSGRMSSRNAGLMLVVLGIAGVAVMTVAANVDYVDEMIEHQKADSAKQGMPPGPTAQGSKDPGEAMGQAMQQGIDKQVRQAVKSTATGALWTSLGLYILVVVCGAGNMVLAKSLVAGEEVRAWPVAPGQTSAQPGAASDRPPAGPPDSGA